MSPLVTLDAMPAPAGLYAQVLAPVARPNVAAGLPDRVVRLAGHRATVADVAAYDAICGFVLADELPATWLHVLTFPLQLTLMSARDFPLALAGMLHVRNTMTQHRPALITEALDLSVRAENLRPHRRGVLVDLVGEARVHDELVWQGRSVYLNRQVTLPTGHQEADLATEHGAPISSVLSTEGPELRTAGSWRLPSELGRRYASVSGDLNPIHLNPLAARAFGFPRAIAHGMWTHARVLAALQSRLPGAYEVTVGFSKPVLLPSTVRFAVAESDGGFQAALTDRSGEKRYLELSTTAL